MDDNLRKTIILANGSVIDIPEYKDIQTTMLSLNSNHHYKTFVMNEFILSAILRTTCPSLSRKDVVAELYGNPYKELPINEEDLISETSNFIFFDYKKYGFEYAEGKISCAGINIRFKHNCYSNLSVTVSYDRYKNIAFNYALLVPNYNDRHFAGQKTISQRANKICTDKDFERYIKKINERFDITI